MGTWPDYETIIYDEQENGVAWVTLNRPERLNSFNSLMQRCYISRIEKTSVRFSPWTAATSR